METEYDGSYKRYKVGLPGDLTRQAHTVDVSRTRYGPPVFTLSQSTSYFSYSADEINES